MDDFRHALEAARKADVGHDEQAQTGPSKPQVLLYQSIDFSRSLTRIRVWRNLIAMAVSFLVGLKHSRFFDRIAQGVLELHQVLL